MYNDNNWWGGQIGFYELLFQSNPPGLGQKDFLQNVIVSRQTLSQQNICLISVQCSQSTYNVILQQTATLHCTPLHTGYQLYQKESLKIRLSPYKSFCAKPWRVD